MNEEISLVQFLVSFRKILSFIDEHLKRVFIADIDPTFSASGPMLSIVNR
jgi:hypothetical protein